MIFMNIIFVETLSVIGCLSIPFINCIHAKSCNFHRNSAAQTYQTHNMSQKPMVKAIFSQAFKTDYSD